VPYLQIRTFAGHATTDEECVFKSIDKEQLIQLSEKFDEIMSSRHEDWAGLRQKMEPLTEDGGVMKTIIKIGIVPA
jgi:hypothetical protein